MDFENSDIFWNNSDLLKNSVLVNFYKSKTIFLTGATGFLGKLFIEKLLRVCPEINKIYILVRPKKGKEIQTRFKEMFQEPNFDPLKRKYPNFQEKLQLISGDISQPELGLNSNDKQLLINETNCVIHCAATVRFDEKLRTATFINIRSVMEVIALAKQMKDLKSVLYISTAFSNCVHKTINETVYDPPITAPKLLTLLESLDDDKLDKITPIILDSCPNTYVFTKCIAESVVKSHGKSLPIGICRPSIVISTVKEPIAGWIDNVYGATGVLVGAALGVLRTIYGRKENTAEMIPADYVINCSLAALWDIAETKSIATNQEQQKDGEDEPLVYNCVSSPESPITWERFTRLAEKHGNPIPSPHQVWHYFFRIYSTRFTYLLSLFFFHTVPAYLVDFLAMCIGRKPQLVKGYQKINKFIEVIGYFAYNQWTFSNGNVQKLWEKMNKSDQELFTFSMKNFDWDSFFYTYMRGGRTYLLKDPMDTLPAGRRKHIKLTIAHYTLVAFLTFVLYKVLSWVFFCFL